METNVFLLSTPEKIGIYLMLGLCGLLVMLLALRHSRRIMERMWEGVPVPDGGAGA